MSDNQSNNKRIAKNTLLLYGRMLFMMVINLYTSRVILQALGVEDYGIYNVVGGVVAMFSILSSSLSAAIQRYITFELGKNKDRNLNKVFTTSINIQFILIAIIVLLLETIGLWFLNNKMVIPVERITAANWVFQFSIVTFAVNLWSVPYNASIIAHEKMSAFAYISILDAIAKLAICYVVMFNPIDRLVFYSLLMLLVGLCVRLVYSVYCKKHFEECRYKFSLDKDLLKEMFAFSGWNFFGAASSVLNTQGVNIILNLFFGPVVNAARGIAVSVSHAVVAFVNSFMTALNPQITKNYSSGNHEYALTLVFQGVRFSYYILWVLCLPIILTTPFLLSLWLGVVPDNSVLFTRLIMIFSLTEVLGYPLVTLMLASGNIRNYQIVVGGLQLLNLPISYVLLHLGFQAWTVFVVAIIISFLSEIARIIMLKRIMLFPGRKFAYSVLVNVMTVSLLSAVIPTIAYSIIGLNGLWDFILLVSVSILSALITIYLWGCNKNEKDLVKRMFVKVLKRLK